MPDNLFDSDEQQSSNPLDILVGEGKKYRTQEDLAKAYMHADVAIQQRNRELAEAREREQRLQEELKVRLDTQEILDRANRHQEPVKAPEPHQDKDVETPKEDLAVRIKEVLEAERRETRVQTNRAQVESTLLSKFGDKVTADEYVRQRATELGVSTEFLSSVALQSPETFYATIGLKDATPKTITPPPSRSDVNTQSFNQGGVKPNTYAYYENMRRTDHKTWSSPRVQMQIHKDALAAGDAFYS